MSRPFPPIHELVPHSAPMLLLDAVLAHDELETRCSVDPAGSALFHDGEGRTPAWVGLEYMAQCAAVHGGLTARGRGEAPRIGLLLGSRRLAFLCDAFDRGRRLEVRARYEGGRAAHRVFECSVLDPERDSPLVHGRLNVLILGDPR